MAKNDTPTDSYRADNYDQLDAPEGNLEVGVERPSETVEHRSHDYDELVASGAIVLGTVGGKHVSSDDAETKDVKPSDKGVETK